MNFLCDYTVKQWNHVLYSLRADDLTLAQIRRFVCWTSVWVLKLHVNEHVWATSVIFHQPQIIDEETSDHYIFYQTEMTKQDVWGFFIFSGHLMNQTIHQLTQNIIRDVENNYYLVAESLMQ